MALFRRSAPDLDRFVRADVSLVSEVIGYVAAARIDGLAVKVDDLPITVGASTLHADTVAAMQEARAGGLRRAGSVSELLSELDAAD